MTAFYEVPPIPYLRLGITLRAEEPAALPPFLGSMLRGAFGHALRRIACSMGPGQECESCRLRQACTYTRLFETFHDDEEPPPFLRGIRHAVRPYVFEPQTPGGRREPGEDLRFDLLLFGQAVALQAYAGLAVERMAAGGLGTRRARFRLERIEALPPEGPARVLFADGRALAGAVPASRLLPAPLPEGPLCLRFPTPLRLKVREHLACRPDFRALVFAMLRRTLELAHAHVPGAPLDWTIQPLLKTAGEVQVLDVDLRWHDWERWSQRQRTVMKLGGVMGSMIVEGDLAPFAALLRTAELVHVGKGATFGLGKLELASAAG